MRQTDSAMRMLIAEYRAVLTNSYIKENLRGGVKRFCKGVALSSFLTAVLVFSLPSLAENLDSVYIDNSTKSFDTDTEYSITGSNSNYAIKIENNGSVNIGIPLSEQTEENPNITDFVNISEAAIGIDLVQGSALITTNKDFIIENTVKQGIFLQGESKFQADIGGNTAIKTTGSAITISHDSSTEQKESSIDINVNGNLSFGNTDTQGNSSGYVINVSDGGGILGSENKFLSKVNVDAGGYMSFGDENHQVSSGISVSGKNSYVDIQAGNGISFYVNGSDLLRTDSGNINLESEQDIVFNVNSHGFSGTQATGYITTNNSSFISLGSDIDSHYQGKTSNRIMTNGDIILNAVNNGTSSDVVMGILGLGADFDMGIPGAPIAKSLENLTELKGNRIELNVTNNTGYVEGVSAQGSRNVTINLTASTDLSLNVKAVGADGYGLHVADGNINLESKDSSIDINVYAENSYGVGILADDSNGTSTQSVFKNRINLTAKANNNISANSVGISASGSDSVVTLKTLTQKNVISAGNLFVTGSGEFGTATAIEAIKASSVNLQASLNNELFGSVYTKDSSVNIYGLHGTLNSQNIIRSAAEIENAGNIQNIDKYNGKKVISALYAEGSDASIVLNGELNTVQTYADSSDRDTLERTVWAYNGADITINGGVNISTDRYEETEAQRKNNSDDIAIVAGTAANIDDSWDFSQNNSNVAVNYKGTSTIEGDLISAYDGNLVIKPLEETGAQTYAASRANITNLIKIKGNAIAGNGGKLSIDLGNGGSWIGRADDYQDAGGSNDEFSEQHVNYFNPAFSSNIVHNGEVNLTMGEGSLWDVTGQSWITKIDGNGGEINLIDSANKEASSHALHVGKLSGSHTFVMNLDTEHSVSDMLYVKEADASATTQAIRIENINGYETLQDGDKLRFATVSPDEANLNFRVFFQNQELDFAESAATAASKQRVASYALYRDNGVNDQAFKVAHEDFSAEDTENDGYNGDTFDTEKPGTDYVAENYGNKNWYLVRDSSGDQTSDSGKTVVDLSRANYANAVYMDTLNKRQGEARFVGDTDHGVWVRLRHDNIGKDDSFRTHNTMVEVGFEQRDVNDYGEFHTGFALDYMNGQIDYHTVDGDGDIERYGVWFYTTFLGNDGQYADLVLKYGHLKNDFGFNTRSQGEHVTGDYTNEVASISAEYGWKFSNSYNYYIEPQVQLQYSYVTGADYTTSQGSKVDLDSIHSLIGRVGFRAGKDFNTETPITAYIRGDVLHEFLGDQDIYAYDNTGVMDVTYENDDTWYSAGVGLSVQSSENTYFFIEGEQVFGADNDNTYTVSGGFKHSF